ncbi:MAG: hypothetical protein A3A57_02910 [Candidatus Woykebacteria bacterium RIFCSPLOWO2_01_FULL_41_12]|uniref:Uncharacterized protein n=1 Tax=Candidatus Woykebacteria bacterium RIFCSPLOWO2_01_FULL_41_12 TaxID=1802604 RepID=A0A1G1WWG8_9BACT|nr:MAG: hypothetical protein A3A57_02910 [Candidatus Woykebacteria bacterium RIFCSPLOWO2_01_FULL_41_12]
MEYKQPGKVLLVLSVLSVLVAALDYINDMALFGLGADSWMLVGIVLGIYAIAAKQWKSG